MEQEIMSNPSAEPQETPELAEKESECTHSGMYCSFHGKEERRDNYDEFTGEYDSWWVDVEHWTCPTCEKTWYYERE
jgi:hypothetical protein